jgi:putative transposase
VRLLTIWEAHLSPVIGERLRKWRHRVGCSSSQIWYVDDTHLNVQGRWCYLYLAIDRDGILIEAMLSETHVMRARCDPNAAASPLFVNQGA